MLARCPGFDSVVVIKYMDEKKLSEERSLSLSLREGHSARSLRQMVISQPQPRAANDSLLACLCLAQFPLTYAVQHPLPREWCRPWWVGSSHI